MATTVTATLGARGWDLAAGTASAFVASFDDIEPAARALVAELDDVAPSRAAFDLRI